MANEAASEKRSSLSPCPNQCHIQRRPVNIASGEAKAQPQANAKSVMRTLSAAALVDIWSIDTPRLVVVAIVCAGAADGRCGNDRDPEKCKDMFHKQSFRNRLLSCCPDKNLWLLHPSSEGQSCVFALWQRLDGYKPSLRRQGLPRTTKPQRRSLHPCNGVGEWS